MKTLLLLGILFLSTYWVNGQCVTNVNFANWQQGGYVSNGNWQLQNGGTQVYQSVNGNPTFFFTPFDMMNVHVSGRFRTTDSDDDYMGIVFSYLNPLAGTDTFDCWLFDWKQDAQGAAPEGKSLCRVNGVITPSLYNTYFWNHQNGPPFTVVQNQFGYGGWNTFTNHNFDLYLTYTNAKIYIDGVLIFDQDDCYKPGRFGFYNLSQEDTYYSNFQYEVYVDFKLESDKVCLGDSAFFQFLNPCVPTFLNQYQSVTWNYGDGTSDVVANPTFATINTSHVYSTAGVKTVTLTVLDNNGCSSSATQTVDVRVPITLTPTLVPPACNGASTGSVSVTPIGGFGGYSYSWNGGANTQQTWPGVAAGTYIVTVTDGFCRTTGQFSINQPTALSATTSHTDANCGLSNGSATIAISGGTPPYTGVSWAGQSGYTVNNLAAGFYVADFDDANGCSALLQYTETITLLPCGISSSLSKTNVTCFGGTNGTATLAVTGGTGIPTISWSNGMTGAAIANLSAGTYTYTYTDANPAHSFNGSVTITGPGAGMSANLVTTPISCSGSNDGQAIASVLSGGTSPYTFNWSGGQPNNAVASNLSPGAISVTVTDNIGCTATASGTISGVPSLATTFTTKMDSCYSSGKGSATVRVTGGNSPYVYLWNNFVTDTANLNIISGTYTVTVTDYKNCTATGNAVVNGPANPLSYTYTIQHVNCTGDSTGNLNITTTGGTPGYTYVWSPNVSYTGTNATNLAAGIYKYTITDTYACSVIGGDTIEQPATALTASSTHTNVTCPGAANGSITITLGGGTPPYRYGLVPVPAGTTTIPGQFAAGIYTGLVTDSLGCEVTLRDTITEPGAQSITISATNNPCFGVALGTAKATFVNATGTVTYIWTGGLTGDSISTLAAGTYSVTGTDQNGCTATGSVTITQPAAVNMNATVTDALCFGDSGTAVGNAVGGNAPYTYNWSNTGTGQTIQLPAGNYTVTSTDAIGCQQTATFIVNQPVGMSVQVATTDVLCYGNNTGSITLTVSGGAGPNYTYSWAPNISSTNSASSLSAGSYLIVITDQANCTTDTVVTISQPTDSLATNIVTQNITCFGQNDGRITLTTSGGTSSYSYLWYPNVGSSDIATGLGIGTYLVTVSDANGCSILRSADIIEPGQLNLAQSQVDLTCNGILTGKAYVTIAGGSAPFTYLWNPSVSSADSAVNLAAGNYTVTVSDSSACSVSTTFIITQPTAISILVASTNNLCNGASNGTIDLTVNGGTGNYTYTWISPVSATNSATNLAAGTYGVTITDDNLCSATVSVTITEPTALDVTATAINVFCFGQSNGTISAIETGGTNPYSYILSDGINTQNSTTGLFNSLIAGTYQIYISDANTCIDSTTITVNEPNEIVTSAATVDVSCYGYADGQLSITTTGGAGSFTYALSTGAQNTTGLFTSLQAGLYSVTVADVNNCSVSATIDIIEPDSLLLNVAPDSAIIDLGESISLQVITNQSGTVTYNWTPSFGLSCNDCSNPVFSGNNSVVYYVSAINANGCTGSGKVVVTVSPSYTIFLPNVFSPNGDGANDEWMLFGKTQSIKQLEVMVFNRWGEKVFESRDLNFKWNGTYRNDTVPIGVYTYTAKIVWLDNHSDAGYKGTLTVIK